MKIETKILNYTKNFKMDICPNNEIFNKDERDIFLRFSNPNILRELSQTLSNYSFYYFYGAKNNKKIKKPKVDSFRKKLIYDFDSGISLSFLFLKNNETSLKNKIKELNKSFNLFEVEKNNSFYTIDSVGYIYNVYYSYHTQKTIISLNSVSIENGKLIKNDYNKFIISISNDTKIKIFKKGWRSFTINYLEFFKDIKEENRYFKLSLVAELFKINNNNEFLANELIYNNAFKGLIDFPKVSLRKLRSITSKKKLFVHIFGFYPKILNTFLWNDSVEICKQLLLVKPNEHNKILSFFKREKQTDILFYWFIKHIRNVKDFHYVRDYINMNRELGFFVNTNITSYNRLIEEHNNLVNEISIRNANKKIKVSKKYPVNNLPFKIIDNMKDLIYEGKVQKHCVASYYEKINNGNCAIYTSFHKGNRYTIELIKKDKKLVLNQCKGKFNSLPPNDYLSSLNKVIKDLNTKLKVQ